MEKASLERLILEGCTIRKISAELNTSFSNVRYWLRKHELTTFRGPHGKLSHLNGLQSNKLKCKCGETDPSKFYPSKGGECKGCNLKWTLARDRKNREQILKFFGSKCSRCNFSEIKSALQCHHLDPIEKDNTFRCVRSWSWKRIEKELAKCILLCANCHAGVHSKEIFISFYRQ